MDEESRRTLLVNEYNMLVDLVTERGITYIPSFPSPDTADMQMLTHEVRTLRWLLRTPQQP